MAEKNNARRIIFLIGLIALAVLVAFLFYKFELSGAIAAYPEPNNWFAGDMHVHRGILCSRANETDMLKPEELLEMMSVNNLSVISVLADNGMGLVKNASEDLPLIDGSDNPVSTSEHIVHWDAEFLHNPKGSSWHAPGFTPNDSMLGGHLVFLGLEQGEKLFSEYTYPAIEWGKKQGAVVGFVHMQYLPAAGFPDKLDCCKPLEYPVETALGSVDFLEEDVWFSESAIKAYYKILNCGFRPGLAAGTDYPCNDLTPLGSLLTYVRIPGGNLSYGEWIRGIAEGRTVISRAAHSEFLELKVNENALPGDEIILKNKSNVHVDVKWTVAANFTKKGTIELVKNGKVVASKKGVCTSSNPLILSAYVEFDKSGWLAARRMNENGYVTHTGAVFVIVNNTPIRASQKDAEYFVNYTDTLINKVSEGGEWSGEFSSSTEHDAALDRYRKARDIYLKIAEEAKAEASE